MVALWLPGAERLTPSAPGGTPMGTAPARAVWHTTESGVGNSAFAGVHRYLVDQHTEPHLLWDPTTGRVGQYFPADHSARALRNDGNDRTNRTGRYTVQVETLGRAIDAPLKVGPCKGLDAILRWMDQLGIRRTWPGGYPLPAQTAYGLANGDRDRALWRTTGGHYGHSQIPNNTHADPGLVDPKRFEVPPMADPYIVLKRAKDQRIPLNTWTKLDIDDGKDQVQPPTGSNDWDTYVNLDLSKLTGASRNDLRYILGRWARHDATSDDLTDMGGVKVDVTGADTKAIPADLPKVTWRGTWSHGFKGEAGVPVSFWVYVGSTRDGSVVSPLRIFKVDSED